MTGFLAFAPPQSIEKSAQKPNVPKDLLDFPQFFPQVWKTLGSDPIRMSFLKVGSVP